MDLTLSSTFQIPSDVQCVNITTSDGDDHDTPNTTSSSASIPPGQNSGGALSSVQVSGLLGLSALGFFFSNLF